MKIVTRMTWSLLLTVGVAILVWLFFAATETLKLNLLTLDSKFGVIVGSLVLTFFAGLFLGNPLVTHRTGRRVILGVIFAELIVLAGLWFINR